MLIIVSYVLKNPVVDTDKGLRPMDVAALQPSYLRTSRFHHPVMDNLDPPAFIKSRSRYPSFAGTASPAQPPTWPNQNMPFIAELFVFDV